MRASIRLPDAAFGAPADLSGPENDIQGPRVAIGDSGDAFVAWQPEERSSTRPLSARGRPDGLRP